jgi:hypothetical protein
VVRNRSAASKHQRSLIHESSQHHLSALPSLPGHKGSKQRLVSNAAPAVIADAFLKEKINKQHERVEQQIKKYDEILRKNNNNMRQQYESPKGGRKLPRELADNRYRYILQQLEQNQHDASGVGEARGKDLIKINGIKLDPSRAARGGSHNYSQLQENSIILRDERSQAKLPLVRGVQSLPRGIMYAKLPKLG